MSRIATRFTKLKAESRAGLITYITAGDPDPILSAEILNALPANGADFIELGMPFSDPMADGPAIQAASLRALQAGASVRKTLAMTTQFRERNNDTPLILMGYYNPIYSYGAEKFATDAAKAGVDGLIIVDLPPEEDAELRVPATKAGLAFIRLVTPTTDEARLATIVDGASGFLYYVSITGVTGTAKADANAIAPHLATIRKHTNLPIAVGFGISDPADAKAMAQVADAVVVGSAIVKTIGAGEPDRVADQVSALAQVVQNSSTPPAKKARKS